MPDQLDAVFSALADSTRRAILARLAQGEVSVKELAEPFPMSLPAISKHLSVLEKAGLLLRQKEGRSRHCRFVIAPIKEATEYLEGYRHYWEGQLQALDDYLKEAKKKGKGSWRNQTKRSRSTSGGPSRPRGKKSSGPGRNRKR